MFEWSTCADPSSYFDAAGLIYLINRYYDPTSYQFIGAIPAELFILCTTGPPATPTSVSSSQRRVRSAWPCTVLAHLTRVEAVASEWFDEFAFFVRQV